MFHIALVVTTLECKRAGERVMRMKSVVVAVSLMLLAGRVDASPIGSVKWTYDVLLGTASAFSLSSLETSANLSHVLAPLDLNHAHLTFACLTTVQAGDALTSRFSGDPATLLVSSVAAPFPPAFQEPSAWVIMLIGLGIVALGSIRLRR